MKKLLVSIFFLFLFVSFSNAQDIQFPPSVLSAGGSAVKNNKSHFSKWRIGRVNVLQVNSNNLKSGILYTATEIEDLLDDDWKINAFPNPVTDFLQIQFEIDKPNLFGINVTDLSGRKIIENKVRLIIPNETVELDLTNLSSSLYIINVWSEDKTIHKTLKVSKQ